MNSLTGDTQRPAGLRAVALVELAKGLLVLLAGCGLLSLLHRDAGQAAEELVRLFHLNPASATPRIFIEAAARLTDARLWTLAAAAAGYALLRLVEAWGLWRGAAWAEWFGALTGAVYPSRCTSWRRRPPGPGQRFSPPTSRWWACWSGPCACAGSLR